MSQRIEDLPEGRTMNKLANMLHSLCCGREHAVSMESLLNETDYQCHYYLEQTLETTWTERDHIKWLEEAKVFMQDLETDSPDEALDILRKVMGVVRAATVLLEEHPAAHAMLVKLLT